MHYQQLFSEGNLLLFSIILLPTKKDLPTIKAKITNKGDSTAVYFVLTCQGKHIFVIQSTIVSTNVL